MPLPANVKNKKQGDIIRSEDWNIVTNEVDRLDTAKANLAGSVFTGPLTINAPASGQPQLSLSGVNWDVNGTEGDLKIGSATHRLKIGVSTAGGGAGDVRIRAVGGTNRLFIGTGTNDTLWVEPNRVTINNNSELFFGAQVRQMLNLWQEEYGLGVQSGTTYFRSGGDFSWFRGGEHNDARGNPGANGTRLMTLNSAGDLILCGRSNPTNDPAKSLCRAMVNWKANASSPDELHLNFGNDFAGGTHIGSAAYLANSDIYFTRTNHAHTGIGNPPGYAAIENSTAPYNSLMILGRMVNSRRKISLWDDVTISGDFFVPSLPFGDRGNAQFEASTGRFFYDNSSRRYKTNIQPLEDDFKKMLQLQPRTYTRDHSPEHTEIGYIAEELQSLGLNRLVYYDDKGQPDGLNYTKMCMYLLEILRDHEAKINPSSPYLERYVEATDAPGKKSATKSNSKK